MNRSQQRIGRTAEVFCLNCRGIRNHTIRASHPTAYYSDAINVWHDHDILECGCKTITFQTRTTTTEDQPGEEDIVLYPPRNEYTRALEPFNRLPENLVAVYRETVETFNAGQYTLCAAGLRALVEGICAHKKVKSGMVPKRDNRGKIVKDSSGVVQMRRSSNLDGKIQGLAERGLITKSHAKAMDQFRFLGNRAVHELKKPELKNLVHAINIIEHTMTHLYDLELDARKITKRFKK